MTEVSTLQQFVGRTTLIERAEDPVSALAIRQWCDIVGERSPQHLEPDSDAARRRGGIVAPGAMMQVWTRPSADLRVSWRRREDRGLEQLDAALDDVGLTGRVATNYDLRLHRSLRIGDLVEMHQTVDRITAEKQTSLGNGVFIDFDQRYHLVEGDSVSAAAAPVAEMLYRVFRYRPPSGRS